MIQPNQHDINNAIASHNTINKWRQKVGLDLLPFPKRILDAQAILAARSVEPDLLAELRRNVEQEIDGWGQVYLANVGSGHSFAGKLSALTNAGLYRPMDGHHFGLVKLA